MEENDRNGQKKSVMEAEKTKSDLERRWKNRFTIERVMVT